MSSILQTLSQFQSQAPEQVLLAEGGEWHIRELGHGSTSIVFLPGALGTADVFCRTAMALSDYARCITVTPPAWADVTRMADSLAGLLDRLGLAEAHLVGSSISGYLLQVFALRHPTRVATLFLGNTFADASLIQARLPLPNDLIRMSAENVMREVPSRLVPEAQRRPPDPELVALMGHLVGSAQSADTLKTRLLMLTLAEPVAPLELSPEKIILIDDSSDLIIPEKTRQQLRQRYPKSEHHAIAGGGHYPMVLQSSAYVAVIRKRLNLNF